MLIFHFGRKAPKKANNFAIVRKNGVQLKLPKPIFMVLKGKKNNKQLKKIDYKPSPEQSGRKTLDND